MEIVLFKDITTEEFLVSLEADGKKYAGLYVDMDDKPSRKYVKDQAVLINDLIKKVDRKRIDEYKAYKLKVEAEACIITSRLKAANEPYSLLIDAHKAERAKILADEKLVIELREAAEKKEDDHEMGLLINKTYEFDKAEQKRIFLEHSELIRIEAEKLAANNQLAMNEAIEQNKINAENARLADVEHVRSINRDLLETMMDFGLCREKSMEFIKFVARKNTTLLTINY